MCIASLEAVFNAWVLFRWRKEEREAMLLFCIRSLFASWRPLRYSPADQTCYHYVNEVPAGPGPSQSI